MPQPARTLSSNHLASLDGLRAFSILMVIASHSAAALGIPFGQREFSFYGHLGVSIFFVVSGLLISWLMIREKETTGSLSLRDFYIRRALRILPVFWLFLLCVLALKSAHVITLSGLDFLRSLTFTANYPFWVQGRDYGWWLHHTWSLSVEEQFYLLWPSLFALLPRKRSMSLAFTIALAGPLLRTANYFFLPSLRGQEAWMFHTRIDTLMMGCLAAFLLDTPSWRERIRKTPVAPVLLAASLYLLVIEPYIEIHYLVHSLTHAILFLIMPTIEAGLIAAAVLVLVEGKAGMAYAVCNQPAVTHIGKLSYGIYLWQQLFFQPGSASNLLSYLGRLAAVYGVCLCSFNFIEKPFLKLRKKFRRVAPE